MFGDQKNCIEKYIPMRDEECTYKRYMYYDLQEKKSFEIRARKWMGVL